MKRVAFFIASLLLIVNLALAQGYRGKGKVIGYVYDEEGNPLEGVKVKLYSLKAHSGFETVTDANGKWKAFWIRGGKWNIDFEKEGYMPKKINAEIKEYSRNRDIEITMKKIEGMVITDELKDELKKGNELFDQKNYQEAIAFFTRITEEFPDAYVINKNIGNCYFALEQYDKAEEYYLKVLEKEPNNNEIILLIGNTYANRGDNQKAMEWYNKIDFEKIGDPIVLYNIGTSFYNMSRFEEALKYYKKAVEIQPDFLDGLYQLGLTHLTMGNYKQAIEAFNSYLKHDPDSQRASQVKSVIESLKKKIGNKSDLSSL